MKIQNQYHLTYCTNIHPAETWDEVFRNLNLHVPKIKKELSPNNSFGLGLYLSNRASTEILKGSSLNDFKEWLVKNDLYVFTMNGFPYGGFHDKIVKDGVYKPDWTTIERVDYTKRLAMILSELLPADMEGGISTAPISYKYWYSQENVINNVFDQATTNLIEVVVLFNQIQSENDKVIHLDIEPEPDCFLENSEEVIEFYNKYLIPKGVPLLAEKCQFDFNRAEEVIRKHIRVCYDICHFAVEYEKAEAVIKKFSTNNISIGKVQISAALKAKIENGFEEQAWREFQRFDESTYLHQTVKRNGPEELIKYRDLGPALQSKNFSANEWRTHFHVPIFVEDYGLLASTQDDIKKIIDLLKTNHFTDHLEVETYTWEVLPSDLRLELSQSIIRELDWVIQEFKQE